MSIHSLTCINMCALALNKAPLVTPHLGFGLDGVHIEGNLLYLKGQWYKRKKGG